MCQQTCCTKHLDLGLFLAPTASTMARKPDSNTPVIDQSKRIESERNARLEREEQQYTQVHKGDQVSCTLIEHPANLFPIRIPCLSQIRLECPSSA